MPGSGRECPPRTLVFPRVHPRIPACRLDLPHNAGSTMMTIELLQAFADAWNRHDIEALMTFMTDDCVFQASAGPEVCGASWTGRDAVKSAFQEVWATYPDAKWSSPRHFVCGERGVSQWTFSGTREDGTRVEVDGCDVFTFRGDKIAVKDSYRKNRPPLPVGRSV